MKYYLIFILNVAILAVSFGFILPFLISAPDTTLFVGGLVYGFVIMPVMLYYLNRKTIYMLIGKE